MLSDPRMKSKHTAVAGPWAFFLMMALWGCRGDGVPVRQESDIAPPAPLSYHPIPCHSTPALKAWGV